MITLTVFYFQTNDHTMR